MLFFLLEKKLRIKRLLIKLINKIPFLDEIQTITKFTKKLSSIEAKNLSNCKVGEN